MSGNSLRAGYPSRISPLLPISKIILMPIVSTKLEATISSARYYRLCCHGLYKHKIGDYI